MSEGNGADNAWTQGSDYACRCARPVRSRGSGLRELMIFGDAEEELQAGRDGGEVASVDVLTCQGKTVAKAIRSIDEFHPGTSGDSGLARQLKSIDVIDVLSDLFTLCGVPGMSIRIMARIS